MKEDFSIMKCDRLMRLLKNWYPQVQEELLAPARMITFMENHLEECKVCQNNFEMRQLVDHIIENVLPKSKLKRVKKKNKAALAADPEPTANAESASATVTATASESASSDSTDVEVDNPDTGSQNEDEEEVISDGNISTTGDIAVDVAAEPVEISA
jgi:hypothetical protein